MLLTLGRHVLEPMGIAPEVRPDAAAFLGGIRWGVPALTVYLCLRYLCDGLHWTLPTMAFGFGGLLVLLPLGYAFTFGAFGLPEGGAGGLGLASAIMMWAQVAGFVLYLARSRRFSALRLFDRFELPRRGEIGSLRRGFRSGDQAMEGGLFVVTARSAGSASWKWPRTRSHQRRGLLHGAVRPAEVPRCGYGWAPAARTACAARLAGLVLVLATQAVSATVLWRHGAIVAITHDVAVATLAGSLLLFAAAFQFPDGIRCFGRRLRDSDTRADVHRRAALGHRHAAGAGSACLGWGPGMWTGLIAGLAVAAVLMAARFLRSSRPAALAATGRVTNGA